MAASAGGCIPHFEHHWMLASKTPSKLFNPVPMEQAHLCVQVQLPCCLTLTHTLGFHLHASILCSRLGLLPLGEEAHRCLRSHRLNITCLETRVFLWEVLLENRNLFPSSESALQKNIEQEFSCPSFTRFSGNSLMIMSTPCRRKQ